MAEADQNGQEARASGTAAFLVLSRHFNDWDNIAPIVHLILDFSAESQVAVVNYGGPSIDGDRVFLDLLTEFPERLTADGLSSHWWPMRFVCRLPRKLNWLSRRLLNALSYVATADASSRHRVIWLLHTVANRVLRAERALNQVVESAAMPAKFILIADMNRSSQISRLVRVAQNSGAEKILGLPVSPYVNVNVLRSPRATGLRAEQMRRLHDYSAFDAVAVVDDLYLQNLQRLSEGVQGIDSLLDRAQVIGSLRYSSSWIERRRALFPLLPKSGRGVRTLVILSNPDSNVNKYELNLALQVIAGHRGLEVVVKPHTRVSELPTGLPKTLSVDAESDSSSLIDWAEVVLFVSSSVAIEAIRLGKPSLCVEYLTSNVPSLAFVEGVTRIRCRDDLFHALSLVPDRLMHFLPTMPAPSGSTFSIERIVKSDDDARQAALDYLSLTIETESESSHRTSALPNEPSP